MSVETRYNPSLGIRQAMENRDCEYRDQGSEDDCYHYLGDPMDQDKWCSSCQDLYSVTVVVTITLKKGES